MAWITLWDLIQIQPFFVLTAGTEWFRDMVNSFIEGFLRLLYMTLPVIWFLPMLFGSRDVAYALLTV